MEYSNKQTIGKIICFKSQLTNEMSAVGFSPIMAVALKDANSIKNKIKPLQNIKIDEKNMKESAFSILRELVNRVTEIEALLQFINEEEEDQTTIQQQTKQEKEYLTIENGLFATQIYFMTKKMKYIPKAELEFITEDEEKENINHEIVKIIVT